MPMQAEEKVFGQWTVKELLGKGAFGKVYRIEREDFDKVYQAALKKIVIPESDDEIQEALGEGMDRQSVTGYFKGFVREIISEFELMAQMKGHTNIVSYEDHLVIPHEDGIGWDILIRMELLDPVSNITSKRFLTELEVIKLGIDMCSALEVCGKLDIIHRDIKPENMFISPLGDFKLGDFGIARTAEKKMNNLSRKGTYTYMAPEVYKGEPYDARVDIYSLGIVMYRLLNYNRAPFLPPYPLPINYSDKEASLNRRINGEPLPAPAAGSEILKRIVLKACAYDPSDRYESPTQMKEALERLFNHIIEGSDDDLIEDDLPDEDDGRKSSVAENILLGLTMGLGALNILAIFLGRAEFAVITIPIWFIVLFTWILKRKKNNAALYILIGLVIGLGLLNILEIVMSRAVMAITIPAWLILLITLGLMFRENSETAM